jgi:hypothetical protein
MRRLLVMLLLLIFPLEMTFAAVDPCCNYSTGTARHMQCVDGATATQMQDTAHPLSNLDAHCSLCALGVIAYLPHAAPAALAPRLQRDSVAPAAPLAFASHLAPRPDRPQWFLPA